MITDEKSFQQLAKTFYNNQECNSIEEFEDDINKINLIKTHFCRFDIKGSANIRLMFNHFISFVNCFGMVSEPLMKHKIPTKHHDKINALFVVIGYKAFDGTFEINERLFIELKKNLAKH